MEISVQELQKRKLFVATPMYGGMCNGLFAESMMQLQRMFHLYGMSFQFFALFNESLITRARNYCVDEFLRSEATHLLFIDADIEFRPQAVIDMLAIADPASDYDVVCGVYPKKDISWEKVKTAVDKGFADPPNSPSVLENFVGDLVFNPLKSGEYDLTKPFEVAEAGTGFMMIQRKVFTRQLEVFPQYQYTPDHVRSKDFDGSRRIGLFFDCHHDLESDRYLSEDYWFCRKVRMANQKVWVAPWLPLNHMGYYKFIGNLQALAAAGVSATADKNVPKN